MMRKGLSSLVTLITAVFLVTSNTSGASKRRKPRSNTGFDYYLLVLSYAPDFCDQPGGSKDTAECGKGRRTGFVVHGLWPQQESSRGPENCAPASPVSQSIIAATLNYIPTKSLIQHEWAAHGVCTGLSADQYFSTLRRARDSVSLPPEWNQPSQALQLSPSKIEAGLAGANPQFPATAFRTSCYNNGELREVRVCMNKDLSPRPCSSSAGE